MRKLICLLLPLALVSCAKSADQIRPSYISPMQYHQWNCQQISAEMQRVSARANELAGVQNENAENDAVATGVAIVFFWPAAFLVEGDGQTAAELARLKGEFEAMERAGIEKQCSFSIQGKSPPKTASR